jgi:outer membrane protein assembly factor BamB
MNSTQRTLIGLAGLATIIATPANAQAETIIFAGNQGVIHQLDTQTGEVTFRGVCAGPVSSMTVHDNTLYLGDQSSVVYAYDVETNLVTNAFAIPGDANAMTWLGDELVVADSSGTVHYIDATTQELNRSTTVAGTDITTIGIDAGGLFVGGLSSLAVRSHIGQDNFQFFAACGSQVNSMAFGPDTMFLGGIAFFGAEAGTIYLFDKFEGGVNYTNTHAVDSDVTAMVHADSMLYIAGSDGIIHEMDPESGDIVRTFDTGIDIQAMTLESGQASCPADYDTSGDLNFLDVSRFVELFSEQLVPGDTNGDGEFNFFDVSQFLNIYSGGC